MTRAAHKKEAILRLLAALTDVRRGLAGQPFTWSLKERRSFGQMLLACSVEIVSRGCVERRGHRLLRGAQPVGRAGSVDLFVLEVQTAPLPASQQKAKRGPQRRRAVQLDLYPVPRAA